MLSRPLLFALAVTATPALAQFPAGSPALATPGPRIYIERFDRGNAVTSRADAVAQARAQFERFDRNRDGVIDQAELPRPFANARPRTFDDLDTNRDGVLSRDEYELPRGEMARDLAQRGFNSGAGDVDIRIDDRDGRQVERRVIVRRMAGAGGVPLMFALVDTNRDGRITEQEAIDAALARFDRADTNKDGTLTAEERRASLQAMLERAPAGRGLPWRFRVPPAPPVPPVPPRN